jgi:hypothetical protein
MAVINMNVTNFGNNFMLITNWTAQAVANGWTDLNGNQSVFYINRTNVDGKGGSYQVWVTNAMTISGGVNVNVTNPIVVSVGVAKWNLGVASAARPMFALTTLVPNSQSQVTREVYLQTYYFPLFSGAMTALTNISLGSVTVVDSFDSADAAHSIWDATNGFGTYPDTDPTKRKANGNVSSDSTVDSAISGGANTVIYGHVNTGPGGDVSFKNGAVVGDLAYIGTDPSHPAHSGIEGGYTSDDMNVAMADAGLPTSSWTLIGAAGNTDINITNSTSSPVYYQINSLPRSLNITGKNVNVYFPNGFSLSGSDGINITLNSSASLYLGADVSTTGNAGINNLTKSAENLAVYALPTVANIKLQGNAAFTGTIYAPESDVVFGGGGSSSYDIVGAVDAWKIDFNGHPSFHYDEDLARKGPGRGFVPTAWKEVVAH